MFVCLLGKEKKRERESGKEGAEKRNGNNSENYNRKKNEKIWKERRKKYTENKKQNMRLER